MDGWTYSYFITSSMPTETSSTTFWQQLTKGSTKAQHRVNIQTFFSPFKVHGTTLCIAIAIKSPAL
jgi:hypothetical protein